MLDGEPFLGGGGLNTFVLVEWAVGGGVRESVKGVGHFGWFGGLGVGVGVAVAVVGISAQCLNGDISKVYFFAFTNVRRVGDMMVCGKKVETGAPG